MTALKSVSGMPFGQGGDDRGAELVDAFAVGGADRQAVDAFGAEQALRGGDRDVHLAVPVDAEALPELLEGADHPEPDAADGDLPADRVAVAEQLRATPAPSTATRRPVLTSVRVR